MVGVPLFLEVSTGTEKIFEGYKLDLPGSHKLEKC
jgi:hypothetical protein